MTNILLLFVSGLLTNNFIFSKFLGCCPFLGVSNKVETAMGMGLAVTFVMALASLFTWAVGKLLIAFDIEYLNTITFILIIAGLVQFVEMFIRKSSPSLYKSLGIYLPLITTNCAVLGVTIINFDSYVVMEGGLGLLYSVLNGTFSAIGFMLAIVLMAGVREKLEASNIPKALKGFPISLISAGLMSLAFLGFSGLFAS
ncbi:MAG: RnfABCDGE type electron transport complex subunit A [Clostridia bacterium]|nr:RnfABCDGE type electron transport complex subunit A [Clostridia bacterium]